MKRNQSEPKTIPLSKFPFKQCIICGHKCEKIKHSALDPKETKDYCCNCVPDKYITKPREEWKCELCKSRKSEPKTDAKEFFQKTEYNTLSSSALQEKIKEIERLNEASKYWNDLWRNKFKILEERNKEIELLKKQLRGYQLKDKNKEYDTVFQKRNKKTLGILESNMVVDRFGNLVHTSWGSEKIKKLEKVLKGE